ncbi:GAF domain-containing protein [Sulfitobacter albidus]|uniref:GAF domain-containing protein n=1 Tax=Sulfitobacter albidus TaxID=2829501 RepID=A0A975PM59_9RHOB|nr:histidine kinase dimerization/phosphoacceptor domain -containing protein [Sulfitobacter albidus]QUJ76086.1 GAF domain-containing protein [Sulfitobacter albidus]
MHADPHPLNAKRVSTLRQFEVLDSSPEPEFDDIVDLVSKICEVPVCLVSLVDTDRQWFKARKGLDLSETPISQSVCAHAILQDDLLEIEDTTKDPRTANNGLLHGEAPLRFYAGMPLIGPGGMPLGTLCILDHAPRRLTSVQRHTLRSLARQVVTQLELRRAIRNEETLRAEMDHRIKNSLQSTSSLVRMYTRAVEDNAAREALEAVQRRIDAMSALHEQLQKTADKGTIDARRYLEELITSLRVTAPDHITLEHLTADEITIPARDATDIGIIVSEFIANSIKHAFPEMTPGKVAITLTSSDEDKLILQATDTGIGSAAPPKEPSRISGIGSSLVEAAASSLDGTLTNDLTDSGARLTLVFERR